MNLWTECCCRFNSESPSERTGCTQPRARPVLLLQVKSSKPISTKKKRVVEISHASIGCKNHTSWSCFLSCFLSFSLAFSLAVPTFIRTSAVVPRRASRDERAVRFTGERVGVRCAHRWSKDMAERTMRNSFHVPERLSTHFKTEKKKVLRECKRFEHGIFPTNLPNCRFGLSSLRRLWVSVRPGGRSHGPKQPSTVHQEQSITLDNAGTRY